MQQSQAISRSPGTPTHIEFAQSPKVRESYEFTNSLFLIVCYLCRRDEIIIGLVFLFLFF